MVKILYSLLLVGTSGGVGLAGVVGWLNAKLFKLDKDRRRKSLGLLLLGCVIQNGVLTYALIDTGTATTSGRAYLYAVGLTISTIALAWKSGQFVQDLALRESAEGRENHTGMRFQGIETRLTAEEKRNTDIERFAKEESRRQDASEKRESSD